MNEPLELMTDAFILYPQNPAEFIKVLEEDGRADDARVFANTLEMYEILTKAWELAIKQINSGKGISLVIMDKEIDKSQVVYMGNPIGVVIRSKEERIQMAVAFAEQGYISKQYDPQSIFKLV